MYQNNRIKWPSRTDPEYVIFFYETGLSQQYQDRSKNQFTRLNYGPTSGYDFSSDLTGRTLFKHPPTVEQIVAHGYFTVPQSDPETAIISDKKHTSWLGLDDIIGQIRHRYEVYQSTLYDLESSKCAAINSLYTHEAWRGPSDSKLEYSVSKRIDKLYAEHREERKDLFKDVSKLKLLLPENIQNYLASYRKVSILEDSGGDGP